MPPTDPPKGLPEQKLSRIFISYKRETEPDMSLASFLYASLTSQGHSVFKDVEKIPTGSDFGELISTEITGSDFFIVLLTKASTGQQGWVVAETETAKDSEAYAGRPKILPVRVAYTQPLPLRLRAAIDHLHHFQWSDTTDNEKLLDAITQAIAAHEWPDYSGDHPSRTPKPPPSLLSHGEHFIVTEAMWHSVGNRESVAGTTIVPVVAGEEISLAVTRTAGPGFFRVKVLDSGALEVAIWSGATYRRVRSQPKKFIAMMEGDTHTWCFRKLAPHEPVLLRRLAGPKDPIVVTFDEHLIRAAWLISHQRATIHESFLIAMKHR